MDIEIYSRIDGAKKADGLVVIFDVFRASNTIINCFASGANSILPIAHLEEAYDIKDQYPEYLLFGERNGLPPAGFDFGNSPAGVKDMDLKEKTIILSTSAGTKGIKNAENAEEIIIGSFSNAKSIIDYIKNKNFDKVSLLAIGKNGVIKAEEDELCANYIKGLLKGKKQNVESIKNRLLKSKGADRLRSRRQDNDLKEAIEFNNSDIIPRYNRVDGIIKAI